MASLRAADLRGLFIFEGLTDEQLEQMAALGDEVPFVDGQELFREGDPADSWWVLLDGRVNLVRRAGRAEAVVMHQMERPGVWAGGFHAWDAASSYLATGRGAGPGRMFRISSLELGQLARAWFPFGVHLIEGFFQTVRRMDALSRQREALIALGTMAAGLAHELNNPASAASRSVTGLRGTCDALLDSLTRLALESLPAECFVALDRLRREIDTPAALVEPLALADREEALYDWLTAHGVEAAWEIAPTLAAAGVDLAWCEEVAGVLGDRTLEPGLEWVASTLSTQALLTEVRESTGRISGLVDAVKSYSQLDKASLQHVDVTEGIESTIVMLAHKLPAGVTIVRDYATNVPEIDAHPSELNQVWTNLIDNAIDAVDGEGAILIATRVDGDDIVVSVGDDGPGMPPEVQARAFEPFFTTKDVGKGTGLGLDISRRIVVERHHGQITIDSGPTGTVIAVRLPLRPPDPASGRR